MTTENHDESESAESRTFNVEIDGSSLTVSVTPADDAEKAQSAAPGEQSFLIAVDGRAFRVQVESGAPNVAEATINVPAPVRTPKRSAPVIAPTSKPTATQPAPTTAGGETALAAPIPGTIVRYNVSEAQPVKAGETVVVLEAMKMENALPAPIDGVIKQISLQAGAKVARGDVLLVIGPA